MLQSWRVTRRGLLIGGTAVLAVVSAAAQSEQFVQTFREGSAALRSGRMEQAASAFGRCTVLDPGFAEAWFNLGLVRFQQHQIGDAIPLFEKSLKLKPGQRGANLFLGIAQYRAMDYPKATEALTRELGIDAASADALIHGCEAETFCMAAAEARASGVPLIVPDRGGAADHARGLAGITYRSCSALAAADATIRLLRDPPRGPFGDVPTMRQHFERLFADYAAIAAEHRTTRRVA